MNGESAPVFEVQDGWLQGVCALPSANADERPSEVPIDMLIVHCISLPPGQYGTGHIADFFCNRLDVEAHPYFAEIAALRVSAHVLISRKGAITQFVPFHRRAWHAGQSCWQGRRACNDFSIGVELEGSEQDPYTTAQYQTLATLTTLLQDTYPSLTQDRILGHSDVAPGRKTDPGPAFDWSRFRRLLKDLAAQRDQR